MGWLRKLASIATLGKVDSRSDRDQKAPAHDVAEDDGELRHDSLEADLVDEVTRLTGLHDRAAFGEPEPPLPPREA